MFTLCVINEVCCWFAMDYIKYVNFAKRCGKQDGEPCGMKTIQNDISTKYVTMASPARMINSQDKCL